MPFHLSTIDDPIQQKFERIERLSALGKRLNAQGVWKLTLEFSRFCDVATLCLFRTGDESGQAVVQTTVALRPQEPLTTEEAHETFRQQVSEHLDSLIALVQGLTQAEAPALDAVAEQNKLIGVNHT